MAHTPTHARPIPLPPPIVLVPAAPSARGRRRRRTLVWDRTGVLEAFRAVGASRRVRVHRVES